VEINRYIYHDVTINGLFTEKTWDGSIKVADSNIKMDMLGLLDFSKNLPEFDFTLNLSDANLYRLNLDRKDSTSNLSALVTANFTGNNIDNLSGEIRMLNSTFEKYGNKLEMYDFSLKAFSENNKPAITLRTDFANADLRGYYNFAELQTIFRNALSSLMPSIFPAPVKKSNGLRNNFTFNVNFRNTDKINRFFKTGVQIADKSTFSGNIYQDSIVNIEGNSKKFVWHNNTFNDVNVDAVLKGDQLTAGVKSSSLLILGQSDLKNFKAGIKTNPDYFIFNVDWDDKEKILDKGRLTARGVFVKNPVAGKKAILKIDIDSSDLYTDNNLWKVDHSTIVLDTSSVRINNFFIHNGDHSYTVNGAVSEDLRDTLHVGFRGIDLSPLSKLTEKQRPDQPAIPLKPKGIVNGNILVTNAIKNPLVEADIKISAFSLLGGDYGDVTIRSNWNAAKKVADIRGYNTLDNTRNFDLTGYYDPSTKWLNLDATAINLPVNALNPLLSFFASDISGAATGKLNLSGRPGSFVLRGGVLAKNVSLKINYLQAIFTLNDSIRFDRTVIHFKNDRLVDEKGNFAYLSGSVNHKYFKDYQADLAITMNNCL
ncbi:MAG: hypothetical protein WCE64_00755, partial [Bacteroidales bacterium]